ncbi:MAG TPA: hypothetical protein DDW87_11360, partial [Firmicutes bacterium]|nr:hypothetical protein [Bacillota bacterium]
MKYQKSARCLWLCLGRMLPIRRLLFGGIFVNWFAVSVVVALLSFATAAWLYAWVKKQDSGTERTQHIGG